MSQLPSNESLHPSASATVKDRRKRRTAAPAPAPSPSTCAYWVQKKRRHCTFPPLPSRPFCPLHDSTGRRACEWCRSMIDDAHYAHHLTICPVAVAARTREAWPFYRKGINARPPSPSSPLSLPSSPSPSVSSSSTGGSRRVDVEALLAKVRAAIATHRPLSELSCHSPSLSAMPQSEAPSVPPTDLAQPGPLPSTSPSFALPQTPPAPPPPPPLSKMGRLRHAIQQRALVDLLLSRDLLPPNCTVIEMGAGKGGLSHALLATPSASPSIASLVLVDSDTFKTTHDPLIRRSTDIPVQRYKIDIADLYLPALLALSPSSDSPRTAVLIGKHLCGAALDLSLHCVLHALHCRSSMFASVLIASCCHHRCDFATYAGKAWLARCQVREEEFAVLCRMTSWGCNEEDSDRDHTTKPGDAPSDAHRVQAEGDELRQMWAEQQRPDASERVLIGRECKRFIDLGRVQLLRAAGFDAELECFVGLEVTRENAVLIAQRAA